MLAVKPVGKPDAENPHVRFDERGGETGRESDAAPFLDSTVIPVRLNIDTRPIAAADGSDAVWIVDQEVPGVFAGLQNIVIGVPNLGTQLVLSQIVPYIRRKMRRT
jgi:hypothetical protein